VQERAAQAGHKVHDRATQAGQATRGGAAETGHALELRAERGVPAPVRPLAMAAIRHPRPVLIAAAVVAAVVVVSWRYPKK
jgi:hypothetical protein